MVLQIDWKPLQNRHSLAKYIGSLCKIGMVMQSTLEAFAKWVCLVKGCPNMGRAKPNTGWPAARLQYRSVSNGKRYCFAAAGLGGLGS